MAPMAKTKEGAYFLDFNPLHFAEILDYLRTGRIARFEKDSNLLEGVKNLADYFGLTELIKELGSTEDNDWVTLDLEGKKEIKMSLATLTRFRNSTLAKVHSRIREFPTEFHSFFDQCFSQSLLDTI